MLPIPDQFPRVQEEAMTVEPQYDGVIMLSPEAVLFSDAKPRPDGSKVYHVFERTLGESQRDDDRTPLETHRDDECTPLEVHREDECTLLEMHTHTDEFHGRHDQLISQAHENTLHSIQQVLAETGLVKPEWCEGSSAVESGLEQVKEEWCFDSSGSSVVTSSTTTNTVLVESGLVKQEVYEVSSSDTLSATTTTTTTTATTHHTTTNYLTPHQRCLPPSTLHQFEMIHLEKKKRRLLKRLRRKGISIVEFEPENRRINIKTRRSVSTILSVLCRIDPTARYLGSYEWV